MIYRRPHSYTATKHWADKPILRDFFWFLVLPYRFKQWARDLTVEWHSTPQLWVAYRGCGCAECPKGFGKTQEEAIADLEDAG